MKDYEEKLFDEAVKYVENDWSIFPCRNKNEGKIFVQKTGKFMDLLPKAPLISGGVHASSKDKEQVKKWWGKECKGAMIGANLGLSAGGRFVIDIDNKKVNGFNNFMKLGISDEDMIHVITPGNGDEINNTRGLHLYLSDPKKLGRPTTNEKLGIDTRGGEGSYSILPNSIVYFENGKSGRYVCTDDIFSEPKPLTEEILEKLGKSRKKHVSSGAFVSNLSLDEELEKIQFVLDNLPYERFDNYEDWVNIGMSLRKFGKIGYSLWEKATNDHYFIKNPKSKRIGNLEYKWESFMANVDNPITIATLYNMAKKDGINWKRNSTTK